MPDSATEISQVSLESLRLRPGSPLQIHVSGQLSSKGEVRFLAAVKDQNVMVTLDDEGGIKTELAVGKEYIVKGFSGQHDFSFSSRVTQVFKVPFPYAIFSYPGSVKAKLVRKVGRAKTSLPAIVSVPGSDTRLSAILSDLSVAGAKIESPVSVGSPDDLVMLAFAVDFENDKIDLTLPARIRHVNISNTEGYFVGVEFGDISQNDKLVLHFAAQTYAANEANAVVG